MKTILPCPACGHFFNPPMVAGRNAVLRCPQCAHELIATALLKQLDEQSPGWEVIEQDDVSEPNIFAEFVVQTDKVLQSESTTNSTASLEDGATTSFFESTELNLPEHVPLSNEWETQSASLESMEKGTELNAGELDLEVPAQFSLGSVDQESIRSSESTNEGIFDVEDTDRMLGVADEPWISPDSMASIDSAEAPTPQEMAETAPTPTSSESAHLHFESDQELEFEEEAPESPVSSFEDDEVVVEWEDEAAEEVAPFETMALEKPVGNDEIEPESIRVEALEMDGLEVEGIHFSDADSDNDSVESKTGDEVAFEDDEPLELVADEEDDKSSKADLDPQAFRSKPMEFPAADTSMGFKKTKSEKSSLAGIRSLISIVGGGFASLPIAMLIIWHVMGIDPLKLAPTVAQYVPFIVPERLAMGGRSAGRINRPPIDRSYKPDANAPTLPSVGMNENKASTTAANAAATPANSKATNAVPNSNNSGLASSAIPANENNKGDVLVRPDKNMNEQSTGDSTPESSPKKAEDSKVNIAGNEDAVASDDKTGTEELDETPLKSIEEVSKAIEAAKSDVSLVATDLYPALAKMTKQLSLLQHTSPSYRVIEGKAKQVCKELLAQKTLLRPLKDAALTNASIPAGNSDGLIQEKPFADLFLLASVEDQSPDDRWVPDDKNAAHWKKWTVMTPRNVQPAGVAGKGYLILGIVKPNLEDEATIFSVVIAIPIN